MANNKAYKGLKNPLAIATASQVLQSKEGQKTIGQTVNAVKILFVAGGALLIGKWSYSQFKKLRAKQFADANIGNPNLIFATIIYNSFTRIGAKDGILSYVLPQITISTDESTLYKLASQVTDIKAVANAYKILFDRNLQQDLSADLDNKEAQKFWRILNATAVNEDTTMYGIGLQLHSAVKGKTLVVNTAVQKDGKWQGTNLSYGNFSNGDAIGEIIANGITEVNGKKTNYYIIRQNYWQAASDGEIFGERKTGVVLQHQVIYKK